MSSVVLSGLYGLYSNHLHKFVLGYFYDLFL